MIREKLPWKRMALAATGITIVLNYLEKNNKEYFIDMASNQVQERLSRGVTSINHVTDPNTGNDYIITGLSTDSEENTCGKIRENIDFCTRPWKDPRKESRPGALIAN